MESYARDVAMVALEGEEGGGVRGADVVEFDVFAAGGGEEALVGGNAESVYLGFGVLDCAGADSGEGFPEADGVVVAGWEAD